MARALRLVCSVFLLIGSVRTASAVVTGNNTVAADNPANHGYPLDWSWVYRVNANSGGTGVAVDPYWLLTAAHVADDMTPATVTVGATTHTAAQVVYQGTADLALLRFSSPIFSGGYYDVYTGTFPTPPPPQTQKLEGVLVGYGYTGSVSSTYYTPSVSGANTKRWGTNLIDGALNGVQALGFTSDSIYMNFDQGSTVYEAGLATYDSGGPVFVNDGGTWKVAGINFATAKVRDATPEGSSDRIYAVRLPAYATWVSSTIPEPTTATFLGVVLVFAAALRRHYRRASIAPRLLTARLPR